MHDIYLTNIIHFSKYYLHGTNGTNGTNGPRHIAGDRHALDGRSSLIGSFCGP